MPVSGLNPLSAAVTTPRVFIPCHNRPPRLFSMYRLLFPAKPHRLRASAEMGDIPEARHPVARSIKITADNFAAPLEDHLSSSPDPFPVGYQLRVAWHTFACGGLDPLDFSAASPAPASLEQVAETGDQLSRSQNSAAGKTMASSPQRPLPFGKPTGYHTGKAEQARTQKKPEQPKQGLYTKEQPFFSLPDNGPNSAA